MTPEELTKKLREWALPNTISGDLMREAADEIERLAAAIDTPEIYAGVVSTVLEAARDRAIEELREARKIISKFPEAMREVTEKGRAKA